jgi:O-antigen ligase
LGSGRPLATLVQGEANTGRRSGDFRFVVAPLALVILAYPSIHILSRNLAGNVLLAAALLLLPFVLGRIDRILGPAIWASLLVGAYAISSRFDVQQAQGVRHTITLTCLAAVFFIFATYGADLFRLTWFRMAALGATALNVVTVSTASIPKNSAGGALVYVTAILIVLFAPISRKTGWYAAALFSAAGIGIALALSFRYLLVCMAVFSIVYAAACWMSRRWFRIFGIASSVAIISSVTWFFLDFYNRGIAWTIGQAISDISGHRANSGRDMLWPYILYAAEESPLFGLGAGMLPRDLLSTRLSAHSYYLQVYLQMGLCGLVLLAGLLLALWWTISRCTSTVGRFGAAIFIMFVVHNSTEVLMFQNNALVAVPAWSAIGLALALDRDLFGRQHRQPNIPADEVQLNELPAHGLSQVPH